MNVRCTFCKKRFNYESKLKWHMTSHTGENPYKCNQCDERFNQSLDLTRHLRRRCEIKPLQLCTLWQMFYEIKPFRKAHEDTQWDWSDTSVPNATKILTIVFNCIGTCWFTIRNHADVLVAEKSQLQSLHYGAGSDWMVTLWHRNAANMVSSDKAELLDSRKYCLCWYFCWYQENVTSHPLNPSLIFLSIFQKVLLVDGFLPALAFFIWYYNKKIRLWKSLLRKNIDPI